MKINNFQWKDEVPRMSVLMPMFRSLYIGWLALESLANQKGGLVPWELIICEEQDDPEMFGIDRILSYSERLIRVKCCKLTYIGLNSWIPLADKISLMARNTDSASGIFIFHAADFYSSPIRFAVTYKAFQERHVNWFIPPKVFLYHLSSKRILLVDKTVSRRQDDTPGKAIKAELVRRALYRFKDREMSVDGLLYKSCKEVLGGNLSFTIDRSVVWKNNISVEGLGSISTRVFDRLFSRTKYKNPYSLYRNKLESIVSPRTARRIRRLVRYVSRHNSVRPTYN